MNRQYDLDWIRVLATIAVFIYHCFMFFNPWAWHVKNNQTDPTYITSISLFMSSWLMPIFFAVSGISSYHALKKRTGKVYLKERLLRLGVPLVFGVLVLTPPQVYIERVSHNQYSGSFFSWFPQYFDGVYLDIGGTGNFAFVGLHLWYLLILFLFSTVTLPIFIKKKPAVLKAIQPYQLYLPAIPLMVFSSFVHTVQLGGWDLSFYLVIFLYGYFLCTKESFNKVISKLLPINLLLAVLTTLFFVYGFLSGMSSEGFWFGVTLASVKALNCWTWLMVLFALAYRFLSHSNRWLKYGAEASMPFYVLHQPVIVMIGFLIAEESWTIPIKLPFLLVTAFLIIMFLYHFVISRVPLLRVLFGIKGRDQRAAKTTGVGELKV